MKTLHEHIVAADFEKGVPAGVVDDGGEEERPAAQIATLADELHPGIERDFEQRTTDGISGLVADAALHVPNHVFRDDDTAAEETVVQQIVELSGRVNPPARLL